VLLSAVSDYGYQVVAGVAETKPIKALSITTIIVGQTCMTICYFK